MLHESYAGGACAGLAGRPFNPIRRARRRQRDGGGYPPHRPATRTMTMISRQQLQSLAAAAVVFAVPTLADAARAVRAGSTERVVRVRLFQYAPDTLRVARGTRVRWVNGDQTRHTATSDTSRRDAARFDVALAGKGSSGAVTFTRPGVHAYHCAQHPHMTAVVVVSSFPSK